MEQLTLQIPRLWADHHVLEVRQALSDLAGVKEVVASAARKLVHVSYDPAQVGRDQVLQALKARGYDPAEDVEPPPAPAHQEPASAWFVRDLRMSQTNRLDLEMSGDFRKY